MKVSIEKFKKELEANEFLEQMYEEDWCYAENLFIDKE